MAKPNFTLPNKPAIKSGSILSYNYTDDFTFVPAPLTFNRDSAATLVNSQGLIEEVGYFGPELVQNGDFSEIGAELVTNGDFATDSDWTKYSAGDNNSVTIANGVLSFDSNTNQNVQQTISSSNLSGFYKITYTITSYTRGNAHFLLGGGSNIYLGFETGTYTKYVQGGGNTNNFVIYGGIYGQGGELSIDNVSIKEVGQNWTFGTGWSVGDGIVEANNTSSFISQSSLIEASKLYRLTFEARLKSGTNGTINAYIGGSNNQQFTVANTDWQSFTYEDTRGSSTANSIYFNNNGTELELDKISVIEVLGDKPRIDYSDSLTEPSLLLEPQSTNLITNSNLFTSWNKEATVTLTANYGISPDGTQNSTRMQMDANDSIYISKTSGLTASVYVKGTEGETIRLSNGSALTHTLSGQWDRIQVYDSGSISILISINTYSGATARDIEIFGAQVEALSYATSYIPTSRSAATRLGETATNAGDVNVFNSEEGVLYAEIAFLNDTGNYKAISINDGTTNNRVAIENRPVSNQIKVFVIVGGVSVMSSTQTLTNVKEYNKIAIKWKQDDFAWWVNGVEIYTDSSGNSFAGGILNRVDFSAVSTFFSFEGKTKNVQVFNKALTDRELEILTIQ